MKSESVDSTIDIRTYRHNGDMVIWRYGGLGIDVPSTYITKNKRCNVYTDKMRREEKHIFEKDRKDRLGI